MKMKTAILAVALLLGVSLAACQDDTERIRDQNEAAGDATSQGEDPPASGSDVTVFDLRPGDCFSNPPIEDGDAYRDIAVVPCDDDADYEVLNLVLVPDADSYPGDAVIEEHVLECDPATTEYFTPSEDSWSLGDRTIICLQAQ